MKVIHHGDRTCQYNLLKRYFECMIFERLGEVFYCTTKTPSAFIRALAIFRVLVFRILKQNIDIIRDCQWTCGPYGASNASKMVRRGAVKFGYHSCKSYNSTWKYVSTGKIQSIWESWNLRGQEVRRLGGVRLYPLGQNAWRA